MHAPPWCGKLRQERGNFASLHLVTRRKEDDCTFFGWAPSASMASTHSVKFGVRVPSMRANERLIIEATYASWAAQDLSLVGACLHDDAIYLVHLPPGAWFMCGAVRGKSAILRSLGEILRDFEVLEYRPLKITDADGLWTSRARIHYGHRATRLSYEATVRNLWRIDDDRIRCFEAFHDAPRLRAFFEMVNRMRIEA
jgi:ketosteroid isomerase-like protein